MKTIEKAKDILRLWTGIQLTMKQMSEMRDRKFEPDDRYAAEHEGIETRVGMENGLYIVEYSTYSFRTTRDLSHPRYTRTMSYLVKRDTRKYDANGSITEREVFTAPSGAFYGNGPESTKKIAYKTGKFIGTVVGKEKWHY